MRIDSHQYFTPQHPPEHLKPILERNRFDGSIVIQEHDAEPAHAFIKGVVRRVDRSAGELEARLDQFQRNPLFRGVLVRLGETTPASLGMIARRGIPVDLEVSPPQLGLLPRIVQVAPEIRLVIDDLASPSYGAPMTAEWRQGMEEAARLPQVFCKASNLVALAPQPWNVEHLRPFVQHALAVFGPERVMFGSGWPRCLPAAGWKETLAAFTQSIGAQTIEVREQLLGGTAARFYGLVSA